MENNTNSNNNQPKPAPINPLLAVQTSKPEVQNRTFELNSTVKK